MPDEPRTRPLFGVRLSSALEQRSLKQSSLAENMDVSRAYVSGLVNGSKTPSAQTVDTIADAIGADPGERTALHRAAAADAGFRIDLPDDF